MNYFRRNRHKYSLILVSSTSRPHLTTRNAPAQFGQHFQYGTVLRSPSQSPKRRPESLSGSNSDSDAPPLKRARVERYSEHNDPNDEVHRQSVIVIVRADCFSQTSRGSSRSSGTVSPIPEAALLNDVDEPAKPKEIQREENIPPPTVVTNQPSQPASRSGTPNHASPPKPAARRVMEPPPPVTIEKLRNMKEQPCR